MQTMVYSDASLNTTATPHEVLKRMIFSGELRPGDAVRERALAERLGLSRVPIREAFQRLTFEGLLVSVPGKGLSVRTYTEHDILDLYLYRECLDGMAARLFAIRAEQMEVELLRMVLKQMEEIAEHYERDYWVQKDLEFHRLVSRGTRNDRLERALATLYEESFYLRTAFEGARRNPRAREEKPSHLGSVVEEHATIFRAIESGDGEAAEEAARTSVRAAVSRLLGRMVERSRRAPGSGMP